MQLVDVEKHKPAHFEEKIRNINRAKNQTLTRQLKDAQAPRQINKKRTLSDVNQMKLYETSKNESQRASSKTKTELEEKKQRIDIDKAIK